MRGPEFSIVTADPATAGAEVGGGVRGDAEVIVTQRRPPSPAPDAVAVADALRVTTGRWVTVLCDGESLLPGSLERVCAALAGHAEAILVYADALEGGDAGGGRRIRRPEWSPARLLAEDWLGAPWWVRRDRLDEHLLGRIAAAGDAWRLALLLGATRGVDSTQVLHHPEPLAIIRPGAAGPRSEDSRRVVRDALRERGQRATVEEGPGATRLVRRSPVGEPLVSVVIPTRASTGEVGGEERTFLLAALEDLAGRTAYAALEIVLVIDDVVDDAVVDRAAAIVGDRLVVVPWHEPFSFSGKVNLGAAVATGELVCFLNDDVEVLDPGWLAAMVGLAQEDDVGMVGATLLFEDGTLQHAGHLYRGQRRIGHVGFGAGPAETAADPSLLAERECSGVTAACALMRHDRFFAVGGFSPALPVTFNDVDLCLKVRQQGWRIVCTPAARLHHFETRSRSPGVGRSAQDLVVARWGRVLERDDPYWPDADRRVPEPPWGALV